MENLKEELFIGRLGIDPELKYTKTQKPVTTLSVATTNSSDQTIWKKVIVWEKQAELCKQYLKKGSEVFVRGRNHLKEYRNKNGEQKQYFEVTASLVGFTNL